MKYLRFTVDVEVDEGESVTRNLVAEVETTLEAIIDNEYPAWVNYVRIITDDDPEFNS